MFESNKYSVIYYKIIAASQLRITEGYVEKHHIIPKSLGGNNKKGNIVRLTLREHYICHLLLTKFVSGDERIKMVRSFNMMRQTRDKTKKATSKLYERLKSEHRLDLSNNNPMKRDEMREWYSENNPSKRDDVKEKRRIQKREEWADPEKRAKFSQSMKLAWVKRRLK